MLTEHVPLGRTAAPEQVSVVLEKSPAFEPEKVTPENERSITPVLVTVTVWNALAVLMAWLPNVKLLEERRAPTCTRPLVDPPPPPHATALAKIRRAATTRPLLPSLQQ